MNDFQRCGAVEARSMAILIPFLSERADGRLVMTNKGTLSRHLQETIGDALMSIDEGKMWSVECKAEEENKYGNFFLETWSNKNLDTRSNHARLGSNPGWLLKLRADLLFYHFLASDELYIINLFKLQQWAFGCSGQPGRLYDYRPEKKQGKYAQLNDTWGICVPIADIDRDVGFRLVHPEQINNSSEAAA